MLLRILLATLGVAIIAIYAFEFLFSHRAIIALTETYAYLNIVLPFLILVGMVFAMFGVAVGKINLRPPKTPVDAIPYLLALILIVLIGIQFALEFPHLYPVDTQFAPKR